MLRICENWSFYRTLEELPDSSGTRTFLRGGQYLTAKCKEMVAQRKVARKNSVFFVIVPRIDGDEFDEKSKSTNSVLFIFLVNTELFLKNKTQFTKIQNSVVKMKTVQ